MLHRKNSSAVNESSPRKSWGPFSGGQLTIIIVAIVVMVALPVGAFAVSGTNSFITDATTGAQAKVSTAGALSTAEAGQTVIIVSGTTTVTNGTTSFPIFHRNVAPYSNVRLFLKESGPNPPTQIVEVISGTSGVLDAFSMDSTDATRVYNTPGTLFTVALLNASAASSNWTWSLVGRAN